MPLNNLPLRLQILVGLIAPPILTVLCWLLGPRLAGLKRVSSGMLKEPGFWAMLLTAYVLFALALAGGRFFAAVDRADPETQIVQ
ncbi:MAG: hypothetical protein ABSC65_14865 [Acidobacteriaceae bacterium]|jgi:hypothetical protein